MATKLYFRSDLYDQSVTPGTFNQGATDGISFTGRYNGTCHIIVEASATYASRIKRSTDGINWTIVSTLTGSPPAYYGPVAYGNGVWVTADTSGKYYRSTDDGLTWSLAYTDTVAALSNSITFDDGIFVSCFQSTAGFPDILTSTDGLTWTRPYVFGTAALNSATYSPTLDLWVAVGAAGQILTSRQPTVVWETGIYTSTHIHYRVKWCPVSNLFVAIGGTGLIKTSPDGYTWTVQTSGTTNTLYDLIEFTNTGLSTYIVAVGQNGTFVWSDDFGVTWTYDSGFAEQIGIIYSIWEGNIYNQDSIYAKTVFVSNGYGCIYQGLDTVFPTFFLKVGTTLSNVTKVSYGTGQLSSWGVNDLKTLSTTIGTGQVVATATDVTGNTTQTQLFGIFASLPLASAQTVGGGAITLNVADSESGNNANFWINGLVVHVWRPSTKEKIVVVDYSGTSLGGSEGSTTESVTHITGITSNAVSAKKGDVIIAEVWSTYTHSGTSTSYNVSFYYNGTTENATEGAAVTNHASYIQFTENLTFAHVHPKSSGSIL